MRCGGDGGVHDDEGNGVENVMMSMMVGGGGGGGHNGETGEVVMAVDNMVGGGDVGRW